MPKQEYCLFSGACDFYSDKFCWNLFVVVAQIATTKYKRLKQTNKNFTRKYLKYISYNLHNHVQLDHTFVHYVYEEQDFKQDSLPFCHPSTPSPPRLAKQSMPAAPWHMKCVFNFTNSWKNYFRNYLLKCRIPPSPTHTYLSIHSLSSSLSMRLLLTQMYLKKPKHRPMLVFSWWHCIAQ